MEYNNVSENRAVVHFYRTKSVKGAIITAKLRMNGEPISTIKRNWKTTITVPAGKHIFSAKTEATTKIELQAEPGKEYYIKCSIGFGFFVGRIKFALVDAQNAQYEMAELEADANAEPVPVGLHFASPAAHQVNNDAIKYEESPLSEPIRYNGFQWFCKALRHYADFSGRARRKEYWYFALFNFIFYITWAFLLGFISAFTNSSTENITVALYGYILMMMLPGLAVSVRRLHDLGKSGWMILITLIPFIGFIWLLILMFIEGQHGKNEYGHDPKISETPFSEPARLKSAGIALVIASAVVLLANIVYYATIHIRYEAYLNYNMVIFTSIIQILPLLAGIFMMSGKQIFEVRGKLKNAMILLLISYSIFLLLNINSSRHDIFINIEEYVFWKNVLRAVLRIFYLLSIALFAASILFSQQNKNIIRKAAVAVIIFSGLILLSNIYGVLTMGGNINITILRLFDIFLPLAYIVLAGTFLSGKAQSAHASVPAAAQENARVTVPHFGGYEKKSYFMLEHKVGSRYRNAGEHQKIVADKVEIGRDPYCEVRFDENFETVSRRHAAIIRDGNNWKLVPLSQTNPSFINGKKVQSEWYLQHGDEIQCAVNGPKLVFRTGGDNL